MNETYTDREQSSKRRTLFVSMASHPEECVNRLGIPLEHGVTTNVHLVRVRPKPTPAEERVVDPHEAQIGDPNAVVVEEESIIPLLRPPGHIGWHGAERVHFGLVIGLCRDPGPHASVRVSVACSA